MAAEFQASTATWQPFGTLSTSSVTLAAGASRTFLLTAATPPQAGDEAGSIVLRTSQSTPAFAAVTPIPVTLRSLVPTPDPSVTFTGTLTGGNGRTPGTGQTAYYQVQIPAGLKTLNAQVSTGNVGNRLLTELVAPSGNAASTAVNGLLTITAGGKARVEPEAGAQLHVLAPSPGVWTLIADFTEVSGTAVAQPFTVTINDIPVAASAHGLPDSASVQLAAGKPVTVGLQVTNGGGAPEAYFADARLDHQVSADLAAQTTSTPTLPDASSTPPTYLVPSHTTGLTAAVSSSRPLFFAFSWEFGDPDLISTIGTTATRGLLGIAGCRRRLGDHAVPARPHPEGVEAQQGRGIDHGDHRGL